MNSDLYAKDAFHTSGQRKPTGQLIGLPLRLFEGISERSATARAPSQNGVIGGNRPALTR